AVSATGDALARGHGAYEYAATQCAELAWRYAGNHVDGTPDGEGCAEAWDRSGGHSTHQRPGGQGEIRAAGQWEAAICHERFSEGGAGPRRRDVQVGRKEEPSEAKRHESARRW